MKLKYFNCYSVTEAELIEALRAGAVLWSGNLGYHVQHGGRELHPLQKTVRRLLASGAVVRSHLENATQESCGMVTFKLGAAS